MQDIVESWLKVCDLWLQPLSVFCAGACLYDAMQLVQVTLLILVCVSSFEHRMQTKSAI